MTHRQVDRRAALAIEAAVVYPVLIFLLLGLIIGGMGVFRYQQVACQAREAARWASVRGSDWANTTDQPSPTQKQIFDQAVAPFTAGMDTSKIAIQVQWIDQASGQIYDWDSGKRHPKSVKSGDYVTNKVRVTITYQWSPGLLIVGPLYLKSCSEIPMSF